MQNVEIHLVENLHLLSHSGDKPHQCNERGKSFIKVGELKKHLRIYSLEKCTTAQNAITQVAITIISSDTKPNIQKQLTSCQGGITCGAIEDPRKSSKAIDERVIINFRDKNVVIARFRDKNVYR